MPSISPHTLLHTYAPKAFSFSCSFRAAAPLPLHGLEVGGRTTGWLGGEGRRRGAYQQVNSRGAELGSGGLNFGDSVGGGGPPQVLDGMVTPLIRTAYLYILELGFSVIFIHLKHVHVKRVFKNSQYNYI